MGISAPHVRYNLIDDPSTHLVDWMCTISPTEVAPTRRLPIYTRRNLIRNSRWGAETHRCSFVSVPPRMYTRDTRIAMPPIGMLIEESGCTADLKRFRRSIRSPVGEVGQCRP